MITEPRVEDRDERHYVAIRATVSMEEIVERLPPLIPQVHEWLSARGKEPDGALFFRYLRLDEGKRLDVEVGLPVREPLNGDDEVRPGSFPAGRYLVARFKGPYDGLPRAWPVFEEWRERHGLEEAGQQDREDAEQGTRAEHYLVGPPDDSNPENWETELVVRVVDSAS